MAAGVPAATTGLDPAKRVPGRKRGLAVDVLGLVIAVVVLAANTHDNAVGIALLDQIAEHAGETVEKALVDQGFKKQVVVHCTGLGIDVEIVERNPQDKGFVPSRSPGRPSQRSLTGSLPRPPRPTGPEHPDYPRILTVFNEATRPLRAREVCEALGHEQLPKNIEGTRAKLKRLVKLDVLTEADTGNFARKQ